MEENIYSKLPKLRIEISLTTLVAAVLIVAFAFVIPIALIQNSNQSNNIEPEQVVSTPQVKGASTEKQEYPTFKIPILNQQVKLEGESGILVVIGILLIILSVVIIFTLAVDSIKRKKI